jgi:hypothetical protein
VDDELRQGRVELPVRERQLLRRRLLHAHRRMALTRRRDERFGGIDGRYGGRPDAPDQLGGQRAGAAADVEYSLAGTYSGDVRKLRREQHRVSAHETVVRIRRNGEEGAHRPNLRQRRSSITH